MGISLTPQTQRLLEEQMTKGAYATADDVVRAGLASLEIHGDFEPGELDRLLAEGEADISQGQLRDGEVIFQEIADRSCSRRKGGP